MIISNAKDIPLNQNSGTLPNLTGAILDYFQPLTFTTVAKSVVNYQTVEMPTSTTFLGMWQPFTAEQIAIKPEGQRSWKWFMLHAVPALILNTDDVVTYLGTQYRVKGKLDYSLYGYVQYELVEDYTGAGP